MWGWCQWPAHNVGYVITGASVRLLFGREVALRDWGYAEARGGTYMYTWKVMFSLFCCVWGLVGHGVWWLTTEGGVKRLVGEEAGDNQMPSYRL
jgi:hypothetical protein